MGKRFTSVAVCAGIAAAAVMGSIALKTESRAASAPAAQPAPPAYTAALRAQY